MSEPSIRDAYDRWATQYDTDANRTRDLNAEVLREQAFLQRNDIVLELGCGTGLNTEWLAAQTEHVVAVDVSAEMLAQARKRLDDDASVTIRRLDITESWPFASGRFDGVVATLVLEHVETLGPVFREARRVLQDGGTFYLAELHPYRQFRGTQAHFEDEATGERIVIDAFTHAMADFVNAAIDVGFSVRRMEEWHGPEDDVPRLASIRFEA